MEHAGQKLAQRAFIMIHDATEAACVRSFIRNGRIFAPIKTDTGVATALDLLESVQIRAALS
ncbi:hypothetical protein [Nesterenkonia sphaerica]|uniref:Uncharacterized protein n=1 Tax=Nesterenkonia sphaerica TaxID=1804988 RepID=A0A5R9A9L2_9MICC|nr:hypothetical protein [Nesterenkonia sphaerica]TLP75288.1 hypothetical protein FEF27_08175 [Nesterenkonia sphaerica]